MYFESGSTDPEGLSLPPMAYCSKPNCSAPAAIVLAYSYTDRIVRLDDAGEDAPPPQTYALCLVCADALQPPLGWALDDRRSRPKLFARVADRDPAVRNV